MIERSLVMKFKDQADKSFKVTLKDIKEDVLDSDVSELMDNFLHNQLIHTSLGALKEIEGAEIITKDTTKVNI